uniref:Uncharacterized protein n=1 Tax=Arundo donax TaxID=35708 RepID=A0A0A9D3V5_ARUDO
MNPAHGHHPVAKFCYLHFWIMAEPRTPHLQLPDANLSYLNQFSHHGEALQHNYHHFCQLQHILEYAQNRQKCQHVFHLTLWGP